MLGNLFDLVLKPADISSLPVTLQIEPTTLCDLECSICPRLNMDLEQTILSFEELKRIVQDLRPRSVELSGLGEPFMNPELLEMVAYLKRKGVYVSTTSNFLIGKEKIKEIVSCGLDRLKISLDSSHAEGYKAIRHNDKFTDLVEGIRGLGRVKRSSGSRTPLVEIRFVITPDNVREAADMVDLARGLGVSFLSLQLFESADVDGPQEQFRSRMDHRVALECLSRARERAQRVRLATNIDRIIQRYPAHFQRQVSESRKGVCLLPWFSAFINADGRIRPCCKFAYAGSEGCMGNFHHATGEEVWRGEKFAAVRRGFRSGKRAYSVCQRCVGIGYADLWSGIRNRGS